ncbi:uncharacterized protein EV422DRAFT_350088 [Fimicolochytrium jonesii]|uniref:uncharacterized protein n=1 Tax=Fimicolochytrium jonesii TaxID=1396493 RepID=UPI0022FE704D|nr:uncharacterized protein EV422DRAFT_350088 [Fimicolochytrium jonesii]KAI8815625.1 hypothetical protein EV422DRAFT_350088 [Fimicolochytrium jonesii]
MNDFYQILPNRLVAYRIFWAYLVGRLIYNTVALFRYVGTDEVFYDTRPGRGHRFVSAQGRTLWSYLFPSNARDLPINAGAYLALLNYHSPLPFGIFSEDLFSRSYIVSVVPKPLLFHPFHVRGASHASRQCYRLVKGQIGDFVLFPRASARAITVFEMRNSVVRAYKRLLAVPRGWFRA